MNKIDKCVDEWFKENFVERDEGEFYNKAQFLSYVVDELKQKLNTIIKRDYIPKTLITKPDDWIEKTEFYKHYFGGFKKPIVVEEKDWIKKDDIINGFLFDDGLIAMSPDILAKDFVPKEELSKLIPYEKHKEVLKNCISKDVLREKIYSLENPYPSDVFLWENQTKLDFNRGRFNRHCFEIWENCKTKLLKDLLNEEEQRA